MSSFALLLVLVAAVSHATWNYFLKKSGGGLGLLTLSAMLAALWLAPIAFWIALHGSGFQWTFLAMMVGSGLIHTAYFLLLDRAYRSGGDLSVVYPLARATGPLLTIVAATWLLHERMSVIAVCGAVLIGISAFVLTGNPAKLKSAEARRGIGFALLTGLTIAAYTLWDKQAVSALMIAPLVFDWGAGFSRVLILIPLTHIREPGAIARAWREQRKTAIIIGVLSPLSYILVLTAMVTTPVSYIAPARELSILFAALLGAHALKEGDARRRTLAALGMILGVSGLALG
ncbi:MAG: EamA family transporter [Betaproteobacteria bacterium]|nr:EamA family transporter [Betaproteobacteria bacterium]